MSHADKIASALALIEAHNAEIDSPEDKVNVDEFQKKIESRSRQSRQFSRSAGSTPCNDVLRQSVLKQRSCRFAE